MFSGPLFIIFIINIRTSSCVIDTLYDTGKQIWELYTDLDNIELDIRDDIRANEQLNDEVMIRNMGKQVDVVHKQLNQLEKFMGPKKIRDTIGSWPLGVLTIKDIDTIGIFILSIDEYYEQFYQSIKSSNYYRDSSEASIQGLFLNVKSNIEIIRRIVTGIGKSQSNPQNFVAEIASSVTVNEAEICGTPQVISSILIQLFRMIILAEMKRNTMLAYENFLGYMKDKNKEEWQRINSRAGEKFEEQFTIYINMFSSMIAMMDPVYNRACDPPSGNWIRDDSFYELEKTFQTTIFSYNLGNCKFQSCNEINIQKPEQCKPSFYEIPGSRSSAGFVAGCAYLGHIETCILKSGPYRFQYVKSAELGFLGNNSYCPKNDGQVFEIGMTPASTDAVCACNSYSDHNKIGLLMMGSDIKSNRVITGLRFVRKNQVLYIQPREGKLEANGYVNQYSQRWLTIPANIDSSLMEPINKENRVFFLDDLILPPSFVLTGVQFNKVTRGSVSGYAIAIFGTHFNDKTGKLMLAIVFKRSRQEWSHNPGKNLSFTAVSSVFTTLPHTVTPSDIKYVSLERSTLRYDFGQSTLPLFDAVPIAFEVPSALSGVGIFHKGVEGYAGFISLRAYGIKYETYFNDFKLSHMINGRVLFNSSLYEV